MSRRCAPLAREGVGSGSRRFGASDVPAAAGQHFFFSVSEVVSHPQGVLHNPLNDRRTTQGIFHIAEGGFPVPADKRAVPNRTLPPFSRPRSSLRLMC